MTRKQDPGLWWHRTLQWAATGMVAALLGIISYFAVKWDGNMDRSAIMNAKMESVPDDLKEIGRDVNSINERMGRLDERVKKIEDSNWWKRQVKN